MNGQVASPTYIYFKDKAGVEFDPVAYFDKHTLERRTRLGIPHSQFTDWPVQSNYVEKVGAIADSTVAVSRWLNMVVAYVAESNIKTISELPFVDHMEQAGSTKVHVSAQDDYELSGLIDSMLLELQTERMAGSRMREEGLDGSGIRIAVFDIGFKKLDEHPAFDHLRKHNRILRTYDFIGEDTNVYAHGNHGTMVTSCIAGLYGEIPMGLGTGVELLLARTERSLTEFKTEEYNWLLAAEWADKHGADIINSSLGYTDQRYFQEEMDGQTAIVTKAANMAARKGILVVTSAGNEGDNRWGTLAAPADSDSVLSVGGTDPYTDVVIGFSSPGPNRHLKVKPNVVALGEVIAAYKRKYGSVGGTSFSAPLVSGFAACMLQHMGATAPLDLIRTIEQSGHLYPYYDYHHGYGVPLADKWLGDHPCDSTFTFDVNEVFVNIMVDTTYLPQEKHEGEVGNYERNLYYQILNKEGHIRKYGVVLAEEEEVVFFDKRDLEPGDRIRIHFECFTRTLTIE